MKNFLFIFAILLIAATTVGFDIQRRGLFTVSNVVKGDVFYVDFNRNTYNDANELVKLDNIEAFDVKISNLSKNQAKILKINPKEVVSLGYMGQKFAESQLLNKVVKVKITNKTSSPMKVKILTQDGDFRELLLKNGYGISADKDLSAIKKNCNTVKNLHLVLLNKKTLKYHTLDCKFAQKSSDLTLVELNYAKKIAKPCNFCANIHPIHKKTKPNLTIDEPNVPYFSDNTISLYVTNPNLYRNAPDVCRTSLCKAILECINKTQNSIEFATFGVEGQNKIIKALQLAEKRGIQTRWVTDLDTKGNNLYLDTKNTMQLLKNFTADFMTNAFTPKNSSALMHNKFFIFDDKTVFTGSANLSNTDFTGFNANVFIKINSKEIAGIFEKEFDQMYGGLFHNEKAEIPDKTDIKLPNNNIVSVYFSPKDKTISKEIIPLIDRAKDYIYIPIFFMTDDDMSQALIKAKKRGVEIKMILDAVAAENKYTKHKELRAAGISVKVENWAGKMHQKSIIIDDDTVVIGSMNFSKSGEQRNDENCVIVGNAPMLAQKYKQYFLMLYNSIPNKWLTKDPRPESFDSIGSCSDGLDNDYDEKIDAQDSGCFRYYKKHAKL